MKKRRYPPPLQKRAPASQPSKESSAPLAFVPPDLAPRRLKQTEWAAKEKMVLRDIWAYAGLLGAITAVVGLVLTSFSFRILLPIVLVCVVGAGLLTVATLERFHRARRYGTAPDTTRIFE